MKIFALETDIDKLNRSLLAPGEEIVLMIRFHALLFFFRSLRAILITAILAAVASAAVSFRAPYSVTIGVIAILWIFAAGIPLLRAFIDWRYDELLLTTRKIVIVNQSSIIRQDIRQMNFENIASVNATTQFGNIFSFGILRFELKEGTGESLSLRYIPQAQRMATLIASAVARYGGKR